MLPVIAIVGRPNVGKSTLFNCLTKTRDALVVDIPGVTRDRQYGQGKLGSKSYIIVDTGGIVEEAKQGVAQLITRQAKQAISEADYVIFVVDARAGVMPDDHVIAQLLRPINKPVFLVLNKIDGLDEDIAKADFFTLGLGAPFCIAASHGRGVTSFIERLLSNIPEPTSEEDIVLDPTAPKMPVVAIVGKPNVGKSTLINRILGEERVIVSNEAGTTRDSIEIEVDRHGNLYKFIDTAGIRRRGKITEVVEKFSVVKSLQAIDAANVIVYLIDAQEGVSEQDLHLLGFILDTGRSLVLAINKWDGLLNDKKTEIKDDISRRLQFVDFAKSHFISALHGTGVGDLFKSIDKAYRSAFQELSTTRLTTLLEQAVTEFPPPLVGARRIKLRYANPGGHNPPVIVIHGNQTDKLPGSYKRYLSNFYRDALRMVGTPLHLVFKTSENPYQNEHKKLTPRQERTAANPKNKFKNKK
jgi:GTP-binding protein